MPIERKTPKTELNPYDFVYPIGPELVRLAVKYAEQEKQMEELAGRTRETEEQIRLVLSRSIC